jgi:hypothetical protein
MSKKFCIEKDILTIQRGPYAGQSGYYQNYDENEKSYLMYVEKPKRKKKRQGYTVINDTSDQNIPVWISENNLVAHRENGAYSLNN